jgi:pimeloyl-ACP methyl ester carboxylesterase
MTTTHVDVPGCRLLVVDEGAGPPVILLHAGIADLRSWDDLVPALAAAGYRVVRFDSRGFGRSTTDDVEFSRRADLLAVMDALGIGRAALVGNSQGGVTSFDTAIESPGRVVAVVGVGAGLGGFDGGSTPEEDAIQQEYERVDSAEPFDAAALTAFEVGIWVDGPGQPAGRVPARIRDAVSAMNLPLNETSHVGGRLVRLDPPANDRLAELRCPVLAVAGTLDFSAVVATARRLEAAAPDARALVWPDVAHMIGMEVPDRLAVAIVEFLGPLDHWS